MNKFFYLLFLGLLSLSAPIVADSYREIPDNLPNDIQQLMAVDGTAITRWNTNTDNGIFKAFTRDTVDIQGKHAKLAADNVTTGQVRIVSGKQLNKYLVVRF